MSVSIAYFPTYGQSVDALLQRADVARRLVLHYQPLISIADGALVGVDALVRWQHPAHGLIAPGGFIPQIELTSTTGPLTRHVIDLAIAQCRVWLENGRTIPVSVNTRAANLIDPDFPDDVATLLAAHGVRPSLLRLGAPRPRSRPTRSARPATCAACRASASSRRSTTSAPATRRSRT